MRVRIVPLAFAAMFPILAYYFYITPTNATVTTLETRIALAGTQADTVAAAGLIEPRVQRERAQIAARLVRVQPLNVSNSEARFLVDLLTLGRSRGVSVTSVLTKGRPAPFGLTATPAPALARTGIEILPAATRQPLAVQSLADGVTLPRTITVSGTLAGILHFLDGLGSLATPVYVKSVALTQGERLQATLDCDLVVIASNELQDAKRVPVERLPVAGNRT